MDSENCLPIADDLARLGIIKIGPPMRVYRIYKLLKLNRKRKGKRRLPTRVKHPLQQQTVINSSWSMDFMSDTMVGNRKFRTFNVIDDCTREVLAIEIDTSLSAKKIIRTLERVIQERGKPKAIRTDNGPEFTSGDFELWCEDEKIEIQYIQPGKPIATANRAKWIR